MAKNRPENTPALPTSKRRNKKTDEEKQSKSKELEWAREKTRINISGIGLVNDKAVKLLIF